MKYTKSMYGNYFFVEKNNEIIEILFPHVEMVKCEKSKIWGLNQRKCALYEKGSHGTFLKSVFADKDKINIKGKKPWKCTWIKNRIILKEEITSKNVKELHEILTGKKNSKIYKIIGGDVIIESLNCESTSS